MNTSRILVLAALISALGIARAEAQIRITEWMYNGLGLGDTGEFVELTNMGTSAVSMTGWSFDDNSRVPGSQSLASLGSILAGESVILADLSAADFRTNWNLPASVKVVGGNSNNLSRSDEVNIYDGTTLIDRLTYNDQGSGSVAGPRTNGKSGNPLTSLVLGTNMANQWAASVNGDSYGSYLSAVNEIGNPGYFVFAPSSVPEPSSLVLAGFGIAGAALFALRRAKRATSAATL